MNSPVTRVRLRRRTPYFTEAGAVVLLLALFLLLGSSLNRSFVTSFDTSAGEAIRALYSETLHRIVEGFDVLGSTIGFAALTLLLMLILLIARRLGDAVLVLFAAAGSWGLNTLAKEWFARPRPELNAILEADGYSYPSGNATIGFALLSTAAFIAISGVKSTAWKVTIFIAAVLLILGIGFSRVVAGVHYPSDIVGGYLLGAAYFVLLASIRRGR